MKKWRYHSTLVRDLSIAESKLNAEGERGWELVSVCLIDANSARCFFKQEVDDDEPQAFAAAPEAAGFSTPAEAVLVGRAPFG